jgi:hypothetical protein
MSIKTAITIANLYWTGHDSIMHIIAGWSHEPVVIGHESLLVGFNRQWCSITMGSKEPAAMGQQWMLVYRRHEAWPAKARPKHSTSCKSSSWGWEGPIPSAMAIPDLGLIVLAWSRSDSKVGPVRVCNSNLIYKISLTQDIPSSPPQSLTKSRFLLPSTSRRIF